MLGHSSTLNDPSLIADLQQILKEYDYELLTNGTTPTVC